MILLYEICILLLILNLSKNYQICIYNHFYLYNYISILENKLKNYKLYICCLYKNTNISHTL